MSTFSFKAPGDLSVGRVTLLQGDEVVSQWITTPGAREMQVDARPGVYTANIEPIGLPPQSFAFEIGPQSPMAVESPDLAELAAGWTSKASSVRVETPQRKDRIGESLVSAWTPSASSEGSSADQSKVISIGLSQQDAGGGRSGWRPYVGEGVIVELQGDSLAVIIAPPPAVISATPRLRLSIALERSRVQRLMVPLFRDGVRVEIRPSSLTTSDFAVRVIPSNLERRALFQALQAGSYEEAQAVQKDLVPSKDIGGYFNVLDQDPWTAIVAALLTLRFPDLFGAKDPTWAPFLADHYPWAGDTKVLLARHRLINAGRAREAREAAAAAAIGDLAAARKRGAPYFAYANQMIGEMLGALVGSRELDETIRRRADRELARWRNDRPLHANAGGAFSWLKSNPRLVDRTPTPFTRTRGNLNERYSTVLFRGVLDLQRIGLTRPNLGAAAPKATEVRKMTADPHNTAAASPSALPPASALARPVLDPTDPNKGRFGGLAQRGEFELTASFRESAAAWVEITLTVRAFAHLAPSFGPVEFYLHDTFNPSRIVTRMRGHEASVTVSAWGGFTVGAWIPGAGIELECDLAQLPDAPRVIVEN